jgi:hypothetical protein
VASMDCVMSMVISLPLVRKLLPVFDFCKRRSVEPEIASRNKWLCLDNEGYSLFSDG